MCHGDRGQGRFGLPLAKAWSGTQPEVYIHEVVSNGIGGTLMPAWSRGRGGPLEETAIDNVVAYVLSLEPVPVSTPVEAPEGPLSTGLSWVLFGGLAVVVAVVIFRYYRRA